MSDNNLSFHDFSDDLNIDFSSSVRFNFDTVIYSCILSLNRVFDGEVSSEDGFTKYRHLVEHLAVVAGAASMLPKDYDVLEKNIMSTVPDNLSGLEESAYIARKKLSIIVAAVQKKTPKREALKIK